MAPRSEKSQFFQDKQDTIENLRAIKIILDECVDEGMLDEEDLFYNELLDLINEAHLTKSFPELLEVITKAKTLEIDVDAWLSFHRRETLSLVWPRRAV